jgi:hypothetical protein
VHNDEFNSHSGVHNDTAALVELSIEPDLEKYGWLLKGTKVPDEQADAFLMTLWNILSGFVRNGFQVDICAQLFPDIDPSTGDGANTVRLSSLTETETPSESGGKEDSA